MVAQALAAFAFVLDPVVACMQELTTARAVKMNLLVSHTIVPGNTTTLGGRIEFSNI
jgi:hypothetical protein